MDLSIITVTWNSAEQIAEQIRSVILGCQKISFEEIIVDNGSSDGTAEAVRQFVIPIIRNSSNLGFAAANNQAAKIARGDFLLFLNPDMRVAEGSLDKMVEWLRTRPETGIVSCKLLNSQGEVNQDTLPRRFPTVWNQAAVILKLPHLFPSILNSYLYRGFNPEKEQEVDSVRGSFLLMRRELYEKLGFAFDPRYFIWFEDVDVCREAKRLGYKVVYTPLISCLDFFGRSFAKRDSLWKQKNFTASMLRYFQKWEPWYKWIWLWLLRPIGIGSAWLHDVTPNSVSRYGANSLKNLLRQW